MNEGLEALVLVTEERKRQDEKWGVQNHESAIWSLIAAEEFGEVAQAALELRFKGSQVAESMDALSRRNAYMKELIQLTAVCFAWLECELRREQPYAHE